TTIAFQVLILLTGNYAYFNWLTIGLCLWLFIEPGKRTFTWPTAVLATGIVALSLLTMLESFGVALPEPAVRLAAQLGPLRVVNSYGLFAVMTTTRPEIIVEGSSDGQTWQVYEFRYKPGDVRRAPPVAAPHQPRLDWQMWFAALGTVNQNRWFLRFVERLLRGEPSVARLLAYDPFAGSRPKLVRARLFQYHFTRIGEGGWWRREESGIYLGAVGLRE
ncbi:MAG TPA: lipase maturation factor family protein, partial [Candidatus Solibacter sp.]|nr:lipase maturation factor family protein [Candidatus Solibacter sp.]